MDLAGDEYRAYGHAMHAAQKLERAVANAIVATGSPAGPDGRPLRNRTLGQLLHQIAKPPALRTELEDDLAVALQQRNWLAHRYFRNRGRGPANVDRGASSLESISEQFELLARELSSLVKAFGWTNPNGDTSYLHHKYVTLIGGREVDLLYFATELRPGSLEELPPGREVVVSPRSGFVHLRRVRHDMPST
jgi:hypothetical protein